MGEPRSIHRFPSLGNGCSPALKAFILEAANGLNETFWSAWGPELQRPWLVLGAWTVEWSRTRKCLVPGREAELQQGCVIRRQTPLGWGQKCSPEPFVTIQRCVRPSHMPPAHQGDPPGSTAVTRLCGNLCGINEPLE